MLNLFLVEVTIHFIEGTFGIKLFKIGASEN